MNPSCSRLTRTPLAAAVALALAAPGAVWAAPAATALPTNGATVFGNIQITQTGGANPAMTIRQQSDRAIINWERFSIGADASVAFQQNGPTSVALNRVSSASNVSEIFGALTSNGRVFLVNPSGVIFGASAAVNVGSLVASSLNITDNNFLAGNYTFLNRAEAGPVSNAGALSAADRGTIALLGADVSNTGTITARLGTVALAASDSVTLDFNGDGLTRVVVGAAAVATLVSNGNALLADGGQVIMTARSAGTLASSLVQTGTVRAQTLVERDGRILLEGGPTTQVTVDGRLDVNGQAGLPAGAVTVLGRDIALGANTRIDASGAVGGTVGIGADPAALAEDVNMDAGAIIHADGANGGAGGSIVLQGSERTVAGGIATALGGGAITTAGYTLDATGFRADASNAAGAPGTWTAQAAGLDVDSGLAASIETALNANTSVRLVGRQAVLEGGGGSIAFDTGITATNSRAASLTLAADGHIVVGNDAVIQSRTAPLDVTFNSGLQGDGTIAMRAGSSILTNGGNILMNAPGNANGYTNSDMPARDGVRLEGVVLDTRVGQSDSGTGGSVTITGQGSTALSSGDTVAGGVVLVNSAIRTATGAITLAGTGGIDEGIDPAAGHGIALALDAPGTGLATTSGAITLTGVEGNRWTGAGPGANVRSGDGIYINMLSGTGIVSQSGPVAVYGTATSSGGTGTQFSGALATGGALALTGLANGAAAIGLLVNNSNLASGGTLALTGRGAVLQGVDLHDVAMTTTGPAGQVVIAGESAATVAGVSFDNVRIGDSAMTGNVAISALNGSTGLATGRMLRAQGTSSITTAGTVNFRPGGVGSTGERTEAIDVGIGVGEGLQPFQVVLARFGLGTDADARVVIGSSTHTGAIEYADANPFRGNLALQNDGAGSAGIAFRSPLRATGVVTLSSGGVVASDQAIAAGGLFLHGTQAGSRFQLTSGANTIGTLAAVFDNTQAATGAVSVDVVNSGALTIGPLTGAGYSTPDQAGSALTAPETHASGDILVRTTGPLTLAHNVRSPGAITLVTGTVLDNAGGYRLIPGADNAWKVYADTWAGEVRGGLNGALPLPNLYRCAFGAACTGVGAGNQFIYRAQPTAIVTGSSQARPYGDANPGLTYTVAGLVNGDTAATALAGGYTTTATSASNVGTYATAGSLTSPSGYLLQILPGTLTIDPAVLRIIAADRNKVYGAADPLLTATYAGLKGNDTDAVVSGLRLSTATGAAATAGTHAILGAGATAQNYTIAYQPGTLTVAKALLTVTADNQSKVYGASDPALTASVTGLQYDDTRDVLTGLRLAAPAGAAASAGAHAITVAGATAANYAIGYVPGVLTVAPAVLTYTAAPATYVAGAPMAPLAGTVSGFAYGESVAGATTGVLTFTTDATAASPAGNYAVQGSGLAAANYRFVQAPSNAAALLVQAVPAVNPLAVLLAGAADSRPTILRDVTFETSNLYTKNVGTPRACVATGGFTGSGLGEGDDPLALEWSRVKVSPNLSNCLSMGQRNSCQDF